MTVQLVISKCMGNGYVIQLSAFQTYYCTEFPCEQLSTRLGLVFTMGLRSKKFVGFSSKLAVAVGMMGKSSWHGTWWNPIVYQSVISLFSISRFLYQAKPSHHVTNLSWEETHLVSLLRYAVYNHGHFQLHIHFWLLHRLTKRPIRLAKIVNCEDRRFKCHCRSWNAKAIRSQMWNFFPSL